MQPPKLRHTAVSSPILGRRLVAVSILRAGDEAPDFERWSDSLIAALAASAGKQQGISRWRISIAGGAVASLPRAVIESAGTRAREAGGRLSTIGDEVGDYRDLVAESDTLVLALSMSAFVLPSTITRLLRAYDAAPGPVSARSVSVDGSDSACVLSGIDDVDLAPRLCSEAMVACARPVLVHPDVLSRVDVPLIEDAIRNAAPAVAARLYADLDHAVPEPLLSIVMRTKLGRPESLREALLCLAAQVDGRFELLLVVHDADVGQVEAILAEQPEWLRERASVLRASGGSRSRPLNVGFDGAAGSHIAVLDDDDVVTSHWVSLFLQTAATHPRSVLRAVVGVQRTTRSEWPDGIAGHKVSPEISVPYPRVYDLADHLRVNMTPFMAFAFPRAAVASLGGADESLEVCEDWDLGLRVAAVLGVVDIPVMTAVYRRWDSGGDSYSQHDEDAWRRDMKTVRAKLDASTLLLPPGSASELASMSQLRADPSELAAVYGSTSWKVTAPLRWMSRALSTLRASMARGTQDRGSSLES